MVFLKKDFYLKETAEVARQLLGKILVHNTEEGLVSGIIVETEAYLRENDPGCHAACGMTKRNEVMFEEGGIAYVYLIYGMYYCFNVVTGQKGDGEAVLVRAVEPLEGLEVMARARGRKDPYALCSGPGKLCQAFGIDARHNGKPLMGPDLGIMEGKKTGRVKVSPRVGLTRGKDKLLRFYFDDCPFVSKS
ncbi:MAG TPA: DNA-3-methyladenine glycosylase [Firmicutes bacterium]|nr:DNA-3-methyladenine glycosylase [Bacillota bacterium]